MKITIEVTEQTDKINGKKIACVRVSVENIERITQEQKDKIKYNITRLLATLEDYPV